MKYVKNLTFLGLAATLSLGAVNGQVVINDTSAGNVFEPGTFQDSGTFVSSFTVASSDPALSGFSATGTDKLLLAISTKTNSSGGGAVSSLTYGGASMTSAVTHTAQRGQDELWYLDNVASDGDIDLTFDADTEAFMISLYSLNGTVAGGPQDSAAENAGDGIFPELTSTVDDSFVFWQVSGNRDSLDYSGTYSTVKQGFGGRGDARALWNIEGTAGTFQETLDGNFSNAGGRIGAVFEAVPEPSSFALLAGMFGLTWVMLRRRS